MNNEIIKCGHCGDDYHFSDDHYCAPCERAGKLIGELYQLLAASLCDHEGVGGYSDDDVQTLMDRCCESMRELDVGVINNA